MESESVIIVFCIIIGVIIGVIVILIIFNTGNTSSAICPLLLAPVTINTLSPFSTSKPPYVSLNCPVQPNSVRGPSLNVLPTSHWLSSSLYNSTNLNVIFPYPYYAIIDSGSLVMDYPIGSTAFTDTTDNIFLFAPMNSSLRIGAVEQLNSPILSYYDDFTGTFTWSDNNCNIMSAPLVRGCPYITMTYSSSGQGLTPYINSLDSNNNILYHWSIIEGTTDGFPNSHYIVNLTPSSNSNSQMGLTYHIFAQPPIVLELTGSYGVKCNTTYSGYIRVAVEDNPTQGEIISQTQYYMSYPIAASVNYKIISGSSGTGNVNLPLNITWSSNDNNPLLLCALPHMTPSYLTNVFDTDSIMNTSIKGPVRLVSGSNWILNETLPMIGFIDPTPIVNEGQLNAIQEQWSSDMTSYISGNTGVLGNTGIQIPLDTYSYGRYYAGLAVLLLIGEKISFKDTPLFNSGLSTLQNGMSVFNKGLGYDSNWGGIITSLGINDTTQQTNGGNPTYSNHHHQYGYFLYSLAVIGRYNISFLKSNLYGLALSLARDIGNPSNGDPFFSRWRHKDWYMGHSYTSGLINETITGRIETQIGDAVNCYYSLYLLGLSLNNDNMITTGSVLMATEIRSAQTYFQYSAHAEGTTVNIDPLFNSVNTISVWGDTNYQYNATGQAIISTPNVFPQRNAYILGTLCIPFTPISQNLLLSDWITANGSIVMNNIINSIPGLSQGFIAIMLMLLSVVKGQSGNAFTMASTLSGNQMIIGNTLTNTLYWISIQYSMNESS